MMAVVVVVYEAQEQQGPQKDAQYEKTTQHDCLNDWPATTRKVAAQHQHLQ